VPGPLAPNVTRAAPPAARRRLAALVGAAVVLGLTLAPLGAPATEPLARPSWRCVACGADGASDFVGNVLLDRVRFDLPLVDAEPNPSGATARGASALPKKLRTHRVVEVPDLERATRAELVDRATRQRVRLPWPPVDGPPAPPAAPPAR